MKKILAIMLAVLLMAGALTACGGSSNGSKGEVSVLYYTFSDTYISSVRSAMDKLLKDAGVKFNDYDANGNQQFESNEVADITGDDLKMSDFGQATHTTVHHLGEDYNDPGYGDGGDVSNDLGDGEIDFGEDEELPVPDESMEEPAEEPAAEPVEEPTPDDFADASDDFTNDADVYDFA